MPSWNFTFSRRLNVHAVPACVGLPARRERRDDLGRALLEGDETLEHLVDRAERLAVGHECAVESDRIGCGAEDELASAAAAAVRFAASSAARRGKRER